MDFKDDIPLPDRGLFGGDPFGYSALAWDRWVKVQEMHGFQVEVKKRPTSADLKSPILWLTQAHAMSEAARCVLQSSPNVEHFSNSIGGICDSQYCAIGLMLVGYSLEISLKAILIITKGVEVYTEEEKQHSNHELDKLASVIPDLVEKDLVILQLLSHFVKWAGRYPDPGSKHEWRAEKIFELSKKHQVSAQDLFVLAAKIMTHARRVTGAI